MTKDGTRNNNQPGDAYFDEIDKKIMGEPEPEFEPIIDSDQEQKEPDNNGDLIQRLENLERRYESSSEEGKRLAEENKNLAEENARLKAEEGDPPKNLKEALGLDDDFVYDEQEAIDDPTSESGKYRQAEIALQAKRILDGERRKEQEEAQRIERDKQKAELMKEYNLDEEGWKKFEDEVKKKQFTLRDIFLLQHPEIISETALSEVNNENLRHLEKINQFGKTLAHEDGGSRRKGSSPDMLFNDIFGIDDSKFVTKDEI